MTSTSLDSNEVNNFSDSGNAQSQLIAENKAKVGIEKSAIRFKHIQFFKAMSKDSTELIEFAKSIYHYRPRVCPFCESKEDLSDSILVEIYRGADTPEFECSCEDFKKAVARTQIEEYTLNSRDG